MIMSLLFGVIATFGAVAQYQEDGATIELFDKPCQVSVNMPKDFSWQAPYRRAIYTKNNESIEGCAAGMQYDNKPYVYVLWTDNDMTLLPISLFKPVRKTT